MDIKRNAEWTGFVAGATITVAGSLLMLLPFLEGMDMMDGGYALMAGGFFLLLTGLITAAIFGYRVRRLQAMFSGTNLLVHWRYSPGEVEAQARRDLRQTKADNMAKLLIITAFMLACIVLFTVFGFLSGEGDDMPGFVLIMLGVLVLVAAFAFGMPYLQYRRALRSSHETLIASNGLYVNGALHTWNPPLAGLDQVMLAEDGEPARLVFCLRSLNRADATLYESYTVEVPVPPGEEAAARRVVAHFAVRQPV